MRLLLTTPVIKRLQSELRRARRREIGGLLLGEHSPARNLELEDGSGVLNSA